MLVAGDGVENLSTDDTQHDQDQHVDVPQTGPCGGGEQTTHQSGDGATRQTQRQDDGEQHEDGGEPNNTVDSTHFFHPLSGGVEPLG